MDFVMDALASGRRIKCLTCVDDFTQEGLTITAAFGISGVQATRILDSFPGSKLQLVRQNRF